MSKDSPKLKLSINPRIVNKNVYGDVDAFAHGWIPVELDLYELGQHINLGYAFSAQFRDGHRVASKFIQTDFIAADFDGTISLEDAEYDGFFHKFASLLYTTPSHGTEGKDRFRVVFRTPHTVTSAQVWSDALKGLAQRLGSDMRATDGARISFGSRASLPTVLGGSLTEEVFNELVDAGCAIRQTVKTNLDPTLPSLDGVSTRSFRTVPRHLPIMCGNGTPLVLAEIPAKMRVHCPFHADENPSAFVVRSKKGSPGIHCAACVQTFWIEGMPKTEYDFYRFEKMTKDLAVRQVTDGTSVLEYQVPGPLFPKILHRRLRTKVLDQKYLPHIGMIDGVTFVRSPKGSGKTQEIEHIVQQARIQGKSVLLIGHRRSLLRELSKRLHLHCYMDDEDKHFTRDRFWKNKKAIEAEVRFSKSRPDYYAISIDSLAMRLPKPRAYDTVLIDECEQVLSHVCAKTIENPDTILKILQRYVTDAPSVYLLDADLNQVTLGFVSRCRWDGKTPDVIDADENIQCVVNTFKEESRVCQLFESEDNLQEDLLVNVFKGARVFVACNSKRRAEMLEKWLIGRVPEVRTLLVTAEEKTEPKVLKFLHEIRTEILNYDVVLASPAIGTGIDITFAGGEQKIDIVYGFFNTRINTHYDFDQQLGRVRNPGAVKVWVEDEEDYFETEAEVIRRDLVLTGKADESIIGYEKDGTPKFNENDPLLCLGVDAYAVRRASLNRLKHYFVQHKEHNGWRIEVVPEDEEAAREIAAQSKGEYQALKASREALMLEADKIGRERYEEFIERRERGEPIGVSERYEVARYELEEFYGQEASKELIELDDDGKYRSEVERYEGLQALHSQFLVEDQLGEFWRTSNWKEAFKDNTKLLLDALFISAQIIKGGKFNTEISFCRDDLEMFMALCRDRKQTIELEFEVRLRSDFTKKPVRALNDLLRLVGLQAIPAAIEKIDGNKVYFYRLDEKRLAAMANVVAARKKVRDDKADQEINHVKKQLNRAPKKNVLPGQTAFQALKEASKSAKRR